MGRVVSQVILYCQPCGIQGDQARHFSDDIRVLNNAILETTLICNLEMHSLSWYVMVDFSKLLKYSLI